MRNARQFMAILLCGCLLWNESTAAMTYPGGAYSPVYPMSVSAFQEQALVQPALQYLRSLNPLIKAAAIMLIVAGLTAAHHSPQITMASLGGWGGLAGYGYLRMQQRAIRRTGPRSPRYNPSAPIPFPGKSHVIGQRVSFERVMKEAGIDAPQAPSADGELAHAASYEAWVVFKAFGKWGLWQWDHLMDASERQETFREALDKVNQIYGKDGIELHADESIKAQLDQLARYPTSPEGKQAQGLSNDIKIWFAPEYEQGHFWTLGRADKFAQAHGLDAHMATRAMGAKEIVLATWRGARKGFFLWLVNGVIFELAAAGLAALRHDDIHLVAFSLALRLLLVLAPIVTGLIGGWRKGRQAGIAEHRSYNIRMLGTGAELAAARPDASQEPLRFRLAHAVREFVAQNPGLSGLKGLALWDRFAEAHPALVREALPFYGNNGGLLGSDVLFLLKGNQSPFEPRYKNIEALDALRQRLENSRPERWLILITGAGPTRHGKTKLYNALQTDPFAVADRAETRFIEQDQMLESAWTNRIYNDPQVTNLSPAQRKNPALVHDLAQQLEQKHGPSIRTDGFIGDDSQLISGIQTVISKGRSAGEREWLRAVEDRITVLSGTRTEHLLHEWSASGESFPYDQVAILTVSQTTDKRERQLHLESYDISGEIRGSPPAGENMFIRRVVGALFPRWSAAHPKLTAAIGVVGLVPEVRGIHALVNHADMITSAIVLFFFAMAHLALLIAEYRGRGEPLPSWRSLFLTLVLQYAFFGLYLFLPFTHAAAVHSFYDAAQIFGPQTWLVQSPAEGPRQLSNRLIKNPQPIASFDSQVLKALDILLQHPKNKPFLVLGTEPILTWPQQINDRPLKPAPDTVNTRFIRSSEESSMDMDHAIRSAINALLLQRHPPSILHGEAVVWVGKKVFHPKFSKEPESNPLHLRDLLEKKPINIFNELVMSGPIMQPGAMIAFQSLVLFRTPFEKSPAVWIQNPWLHDIGEQYQVGLAEFRHHTLPVEAGIRRIVNTEGWNALCVLGLVGGAQGSTRGYVPFRNPLVDAPEIRLGGTQYLLHSVPADYLQTIRKLVYNRTAVLTDPKNPRYWYYFKGTGLANSELDKGVFTVIHRSDSYVNKTGGASFDEGEMDSLLLLRQTFEKAWREKDPVLIVAARYGVSEDMFPAPIALATPQQFPIGKDGEVQKWPRDEFYKQMDLPNRDMDVYIYRGLGGLRVRALGDLQTDWANWQPYFDYYGFTVDENMQCTFNGHASSLLDASHAVLFGMAARMGVYVHLLHNRLDKVGNSPETFSIFMDQNMSPLSTFDHGDPIRNRSESPERAPLLDYLAGDMLLAEMNQKLQLGPADFATAKTIFMALAQNHPGRLNRLIPRLAGTTPKPANTTQASQSRLNLARMVVLIFVVGGLSALMGYAAFGLPAPDVTQIHHLMTGQRLEAASVLGLLLARFRRFARRLKENRRPYVPFDQAGQETFPRNQERTDPNLPKTGKTPLPEPFKISDPDDPLFGVTAALIPETGEMCVFVIYNFVRETENVPVDPANLGMGRIVPIEKARIQLAAGDIIKLPDGNLVKAAAPEKPSPIAPPPVEAKPLFSPGALFQEPDGKGGWLIYQLREKGPDGGWMFNVWGQTGWLPWEVLEISEADIQNLRQLHGIPQNPATVETAPFTSVTRIFPVPPPATPEGTEDPIAKALRDLGYTSDYSLQFGWLYDSQIMERMASGEVRFPEDKTNPKPSEVLQGWKFHISLMDQDAYRVLRIIIPLLRDMKLAHKIRPTLAAVRNPRGHPTQGGKDIAIYVMDSDIHRLAGRYGLENFPTEFGIKLPEIVAMLIGLRLDEALKSAGVVPPSPDIAWSDTGLGRDKRFGGEGSSGRVGYRMGGTNSDFLALNGQLIVDDRAMHKSANLTGTLNFSLNIRRTILREILMGKIAFPTILVAALSLLSVVMHPGHALQADVLGLWLAGMMATHTPWRQRSLWIAELHSA